MSLRLFGRSSEETATIPARGPVETTWKARPVMSAVLSLGITVLPIVASIGAAEVIARAFPRGAGAVAIAEWWLLVLTVSTGVLLATERGCRRLLPLRSLLRMTLVLPDQIPSRFAIALRTGSTRKLANASGSEHGGPAAAEILRLASQIGHHDRSTRGHSERVRAFADMIGQELKLSEGDRERLRWSALLHDVGKLAVHPDILNKQTQPNAAEWEELRRHPIEGSRLIEALKGWFGEWALTVEQHHERYDGSGYPFGLAGEQICLGARIVGVADAFEVMTAVRSYKQPVSLLRAREELTRCAGRQFDPDVVRALLNISLPRLRWAMGLTSFVLTIPVVGRLARSSGSSVLGRAIPAASHIGTNVSAVLVAAITVLPISQRPPVKAGSVPVAASVRMTRHSPLPSGTFVAGGHSLHSAGQGLSLGLTDRRKAPSHGITALAKRPLPARRPSVRHPASLSSKPAESANGAN
ncbi:MAG: HD-GYP domain-containing protein [Acidimicrobiales bacterium]